MSDKRLFHCRVCGVECDSHPIKDLPNCETAAIQAVCEEHCEGHDFEYDGMRRGQFCKHCDAQLPLDCY